MSGLSACVNAIEKNIDLEIFESSGMAGGRCRSFFDKKIGGEIDNGNHLVLSANENFLNFCEKINSLKTLKKIAPNFYFFDFKETKKWNLNLDEKFATSWIFNKNKRIPGSSPFDYISFLKFIFVKKNKKVFDLIGNSNIFKSFWEPFTLGIMNTSPKEASAKVLSNVLKKTIFRGKNKCYLYQPKKNWNDTLIHPCLGLMKKKGFNINFKTTLKRVAIKKNRITELVFDKKSVKIDSSEKVVLALPLNQFNKIFSNYSVPNNYNTILNVHFKLAKNFLKLFDNQIIGMVNSISQWIFVKENHISVTVSNANNYNEMEVEKIASLVWEEVCKYLSVKKRMVDFRVIREKKATYEQSPENIELLKKIKKIPENLILAGDWTQINLPCTIEGSILSGKKAIELLKF